jgi:dihydroflavonol-4-reductase
MFVTMNPPPSSVHPESGRKLVFVTGATGLLGNNLVRQLLAAGHRVRALVRSEEKARRMLGDLDIEVIAGDMEKVDAFAAALDGCDAVIHTAAYFREYYQPGDHAAHLERINVRSTLELMAQADARRVGTFIHTSSSGAVGMKADGSPGDEDTPPSPEQLENGYFRSKVVGDQEIRSWTPANGMKVVEILPGWMWGPGDAGPTAAGQLVLDFTAKKIPIVPEGGTSTVDARDVAAAMITCLDRAHHGDRFIVAGEFRALEDIMTDLASLTGVRGPTMRLPHALVMTFAFFEELRAKLTGGRQLVSRDAIRLLRWRHTVSSARATRKLGVTFRPFADTARDVVAWYAAHPQPAAMRCSGPSRSTPQLRGTHLPAGRRDAAGPL